MFRWLSIWFLLIATGFFNLMTNAQNAPITWIGSANPCNITNLSFPVIDTNFTNITSISLRLDYNPQVMVYDTFLAINPILSGLLVNDAIISDSLHKLMIVWSDVNPKTIPSGQSLVTLQFSYLSGATNLYWNNVANGGADCEYSDAIGNALNDLPSESYYKSGYVQGGVVGNAGPILGDTVVCSGETDGIYGVAPIENATAYLWTTPSGAVITSGGETNIIHVDFSNGSSSGDFQVRGQAGSCHGLPSPVLFVELKPQPIPPVISLQGTCLISNQTQGIQWYDQNGVIPNATQSIYCPSQDGDYYATVIENGCTSEPSNVIHYIYVGINEAEDLGLVIINVPGQMIELKIKTPGESQIGVKLYNMLGNELYTRIVDTTIGVTHRVEIPARNLSAGTFILEMKIGSQKTTKVIRKKIMIL